MSDQHYPIHGQVPPGTIADEAMVHIQDTMHATIREAVMVTEHLDTGDIQAAVDALIQIRLNAVCSIERVDRALGRPERRISAHDQETLDEPVGVLARPPESDRRCLRCGCSEADQRRDPAGNPDWVWMLPDGDANLCSDCQTPEDEPVIRALQALRAAALELRNQIRP